MASTGLLSSTPPGFPGTTGGAMNWRRSRQFARGRRTGNILAFSPDGRIPFVADRNASRIVCIEPAP
jgi:hypothetical protein